MCLTGPDRGSSVSSPCAMRLVTPYSCPGPRGRLAIQQFSGHFTTPRRCDPRPYQTNLRLRKLLTSRNGVSTMRTVVAIVQNTPHHAREVRTPGVPYQRPPSRSPFPNPPCPNLPPPPTP